MYMYTHRVRPWLLYYIRTTCIMPAEAPVRVPLPLGCIRFFFFWGASEKLFVVSGGAGDGFLLLLLVIGVNSTGDHHSHHHRRRHTVHTRIYPSPSRPFALRQTDEGILLLHYYNNSNNDDVDRGKSVFFYYYYSAYTRGTSLCFLSAAFLVRNRQTSLHGHTKTPASWVGSQCRGYYIIVTKLLLKRARVLPWLIDVGLLSFAVLI